MIDCSDYPKAAGVFFDYASGVMRRQLAAGRMDLRCNFSSSSSSSSPQQTTQTVSGAGSPSTTGNHSPVNTGTQISAGQNLTVNTTTDLGAVNSAFTFAGSALATVQANAAAAGVGANQVTDLLRASIANQANTNSGGAATSSKTFLTTLAIMAGLALIGLIFWKGKKA